MVTHLELSKFNVDLYNHFSCSDIFVIFFLQKEDIALGIIYSKKQYDLLNIVWYFLAHIEVYLQTHGLLNLQ